MTGTDQRLRHVLAGLSFPAQRWQVIAEAEHYGADARTRRELRALPAGPVRVLRRPPLGAGAGPGPPARGVATHTRRVDRPWREPRRAPSSTLARPSRSA